MEEVEDKFEFLFYIASIDRWKNKILNRILGNLLRFFVGEKPKG
jgi:hypothetical protein